MSAKKQAESPLPLPERWNGTAEDKKRVHAEVAAVLRAVAQALGLSVGAKSGAGDCEIGSSMFGPVLGGEIHLYADGFHLWVNAGSVSEWGDAGESDRRADVSERRAQGYMIARRTAHRRDFVGIGENAEFPWELLWDPQNLADILLLEVLAPVNIVSGSLGERDERSLAEDERSMAEDE